MNDEACRSCEPAMPLEALDAQGQRERLAAWAKALGHPARVRIVEVLLRQDGCICGDIVDQLDLAQSTVSQHLKILKQAGLIRGSIDGPRVCYCVDPLALAGLAQALTQLAAIASPAATPADSRAASPA
jgi:ArsR family transcriptional regulator